MVRPEPWVFKLRLFLHLRALHECAAAGARMRSLLNFEERVLFRLVMMRERNLEIHFSHIIRYDRAPVTESKIPATSILSQLL